MKSFRSIAFAASAAALQLEGSPEWDHVFDPIERDHYVKKEEVGDFSDRLSVNLSQNTNNSMEETTSVNNAIQGLIDWVMAQEDATTMEDVAEAG